MNFEEYRRYDGLGLAELVATQQVSAAELTELALARMDAVNPRLNAIVTRLDARARQSAKQATNSTPAAPFAGVPFVVKDLMQDLAGVPTSAGSRAMRHHVPQQHAEITRRWLQAGVVPVGLSNAAEFGLAPQTEPSLWGAVHNPWRHGCSAGGSSGGSAAAVAAGIAPLAGGNDVGGSIRIPAALCGLFGFKPGRGRIPWGAPQAEFAQGAAVQHVLTRSVRDSAAMLDATMGPMPSSPFHIAPPERPYLQELAREPGRLRIGFCVTSPLPVPVDAHGQAAVRHTAALLSSLGHHVEEHSPPVAWPDFYSDVMALMYTMSAAVVKDVQAMTGCRHSAFEPDTRLMAAAGRLMRADALQASLLRRHQHHEAWSGFRQRCDLWLSPVVTTAHLPLGAMRTPRWQAAGGLLAFKLGLGQLMLDSPMARKRLAESLGYVPFTTLANLLGLPSMSVPMHWSSEGLPAGVLLTGGIGEEGMLFRLAAQLEQAQPWFMRVPPPNHLAPDPA